VIYSLVLLPNGYLASSSGDLTIKLWDMENGFVVKTLQGHKGVVYSLHTLPNGYLISICDYGEIKIWNEGILIRNLVEPSLHNDSFDMAILALLEDGLIASSASVNYNYLTYLFHFKLKHIFI
jgi:WD40 repeat protein